MHWNRQPSQSVIEINDFDVETEAEKGAGLFFSSVPKQEREEGQMIGLD